MDMARTLDGNGMEISTAYGVAGDVALYVTDGTLNVQNVILADNVDLVVSGGTVNILSGTYNGEVSASSGTLSITGGTFSTDVSSYVREGFTAQPDGSVWNVVQSTVSAAPAAPYVVVPDTIDPSDAATVTESAGTIAADTETAASMAQEATEAAADLTDDDKQQYLEAGKEQLTALPDVTPEQVAAAVLVTVPSIKIEVEAYMVGSSFRVDITPTVQFAVAVDPDDIQMGTNAVSVGENTLDMTDVSVTLSITLPTGFVQDTTTPIFVEHSGYAYRGTLESVSAGIQLTFTNPGHGFSPHEIRLDSPVAEPVDETVPYSYYSYDTALADTEVDAIRLLEAPTTPLTVNRAMTISADEGIDLTTAVTAGTGFEIQQNSDGSISVVSETAETYILTVADVQNGSIAHPDGRRCAEW